MHEINLTAAQNKILEKAKITCAEQLIRQMPNRYDDCRQVFAIGPSIIDQTVSIIGILSSVSSKSTTRIPMCIYFAPSAKKSWGYTSGGFWTREAGSYTRFMGLYATAYGNPLNVECAHSYSEGTIGDKNCVHAHAGRQLCNDEIIFYNESAMLLTYLVEFAA